MLRFKKMMAVLLAAALVLTMLTACGGGGGRSSSSENQKLTVEINKELTKAGFTALQYSKSLDQKLAAYVDFKKVNEATAAANAGISSDEYFLKTVTITKDKDKTNELVNIIKGVIGEANKSQKWEIGYYTEQDASNEENIIVQILMKRPTAKK